MQRTATKEGEHGASHTNLLEVRVRDLSIKASSVGLDEPRVEHKTFPNKFLTSKFVIEQSPDGRVQTVIDRKHLLSDDCRVRYYIQSTSR